MARCGKVWYGMARYGKIWYGLGRCGKVWNVWKRGVRVGQIVVGVEGVGTDYVGKVRVTMVK